MNPRIGFIGLGAMGLPMANNLRQAGYDVLAMDLNTACMRRYADLGGRTTEVLADLVASSDIVLTMLPTGEHVRACLDELISAGLQARVFMDCSTIGVEHARALHETAAVHGLRYVDAPVSGGVMGAEKATLALMVGADPADFEQVLPVLQAVGKAITHTGPPGTGQAVKVCNNMAAGIIKIAVSEAFALARSLGVSDQVLFDVASKSSASCFALTTTCPVPGLLPNAPSSHGYQGGFATRLMLKDMKLAQSAAASYGVAVTMGSAATSLYEHCVGAGLGDLDNSIVFKFITKDY